MNVEPSEIKKTEKAIDELLDLWRRRKAVCILVIGIIALPSAFLFYEKFGSKNTPSYSSKTTGTGSPIINAGDGSKIEVKTGLTAEDAAKIGEALYQARMEEKVNELDRQLAKDYDLGYVVFTLVGPSEIVPFKSPNGYSLNVDWSTAAMNSRGGVIDLTLPTIIFDDGLRLSDQVLSFNAAVGSKLPTSRFGEFKLTGEVIDHYKNGTIIVLGGQRVAQK